jgi:V/A-type H+/Na+-transporting ATPase subunit D
MARLNIAPTKSNLLSLRRDLGVATEGFSLLDQKREILVMELMLLLNQARELQDRLAEAQRRALEALRLAIARHGADRLQAATGSVRYNHRVQSSTRVVAGVRVPQISATIDTIRPQFAFSGSDPAMDELMRRHLDLLVLAGELAQLETSVYLLTHDLKKTQRRVNALEQVFIPNFKDTLKFVRDSLESKELESIFVLKLVKNRLAEGREKSL